MSPPPLIPKAPIAIAPTKLMGQPAKVFVMTGPSGAGKTQVCQGIVAAAPQHWQIGGLISLGVWHQGQKVAIDAWDPASGHRKRLAHRRPFPDHSPTPHWQFDPEVWDWGNGIFQGLGYCDLLVVDELGPLELEHQQGWVAALPVIASQHYRFAVITLRPRLGHWAPVWGAESIPLSEPGSPGATPASALTLLQQSLFPLASAVPPLGEPPATPDPACP